MEGRVSVAVLLGDLALSGDEDASDPGMPVPRRRVEWRVAVLKKQYKRSIVAIHVTVEDLEMVHVSAHIIKLKHTY